MSVQLVHNQSILLRREFYNFLFVFTWSSRTPARSKPAAFVPRVLIFCPIAIPYGSWSLWRLSGSLGWFIAHLPAAACMGQIRTSSAVFLAAHAREFSHLALRLDFIRRIHDFLVGDVRPCTGTAALLLHFSKRGALANETGVVGRDNVIRSALCKISAFLIRWLGYGIEFKIEVILHGADDEDV